MWLDRLSGHSTPSTSSTPRNRSSSPAPRRSINLAPSLLGQPRRPAFSPRSSSLSLASNASGSSSVDHARHANGSSLKHSTVNTPPITIEDPLEVLERIVGGSLKHGSRHASIQGDISKLSDYSPSSELVKDIDFKGLSLHEFAAGEKEVDDVPMYKGHSVEECMHSRLMVAPVTAASK